MTLDNIKFKLLDIMTKHFCEVKNCSDSNDKQYPECEMKLGYKCPAMHMKVFNLVNSVGDYIHEKDSK
jgi:hypothetical protein